MGRWGCDASHCRVKGTEGIFLSLNIFLFKIILSYFYCLVFNLIFIFEYFYNKVFGKLILNQN